METGDVGNIAATDETVVGTPVVEQAPPTLEAQLEAMKADMAVRAAELEKATSQINSYKGSLAEKDRKLKETGDLRSEFETMKSMIKVLATNQSSRDEDLEVTASQRKPNVDEEFAKLEKKMEADKANKQVMEQIGVIQSRVEALKLNENDVDYLEIFKLATSGNPVDLKIANVKLTKMEKEKEILVESTPDERDKKITELEARLKKSEQIASGELDSETGRPTGASASESDVRKNFREAPYLEKNRRAYNDLIASKKQ